MINYDLFKTILEQEDDGYIVPKDYISQKLLRLFVNAPKIDKVKSLFRKNNNSDGEKFVVECVCEKCGVTFDNKMTKSRLYNMLYKLRGSKTKHEDIFCPKCSEEERILRIEKNRKEDIDYKKQKKERTKKYIYYYLSTDMQWNDDVPIYSKISSLMNENVFWDEIIKHIKNMDYYSFLKTPYWKAISEKVKKNANFRCQMCNSDKNLITHHRTYANHGDEIHHLNDLICICQDCHEKYHFD